MQDSIVSVLTVPPMPLAAVRRWAAPETIATTIIAAPIWALTWERRMATLDQTVVIYYGRTHDTSGEPILLDVGILLPKPFEGDALLQFVETPGGQVARARLVGGYEQIPGVHDRIREWCRTNGHAITGTNWEHYGHWHEEPERCLTDVYYQLAG